MPSTGYRLLREALVLLLLAAGPPRLHAANLVWLEAEQFPQCGGWVNDAQFIDQMGSPYLLANGLGTPVADAVATVRLPAAGKYRLWARTKDWIPEHHPGTFQILLDGQAAPTTFGRSGQAGWRWEDGGVHALTGQVELRLHDLTGFYGRCDAIVLTDDVAWIPPGGPDEIARLREQHGGVSAAVTDLPEFDVVVVGGGLAGCTAAVAAARPGHRTALLQNRPLLGGNASTEILVPPVGVWYGIFRHRFPLDPRETGLVEEYRTAGKQQVSEGKLYSARLLRFVQAEPALQLCLDTHATGVEMRPGPERQIAAVLAVNTHTGQRLRFRGKLFIDCTGDAVVGVAAGAEYRHGKEPKALYDEPWAPETPVKDTMGNGLKYFPADTGEPQPFATPRLVLPLPALRGLPARPAPAAAERQRDRVPVDDRTGRPTRHLRRCGGDPRRPAAADLRTVGPHEEPLPEAEGCDGQPQAGLGRPRRREAGEPAADRRLRADAERHRPPDAVPRPRRLGRLVLRRSPFGRLLP